MLFEHRACRKYTQKAKVVRPDKKTRASGTSVENYLGHFLEKLQKIGQNGRPGRREPPRSSSFHETSRMVVWKTTWAIFWKNCKKYGKSTKKCLSNEGARFARPFCRQLFVLFPYFFNFSKNGPGSFPHLTLAQDKPCKAAAQVLETCRNRRVICKQVASRSGTIGAQSEN